MIGQRVNLSRRLRWLRYTLGTLIVLVSFYFLLNRLWQDWHQIPFSRLHFTPHWLVLSYLVLLFFHFPLGAYGWRLILVGLGERIGFSRALGIITVTQLGKYAPGKIWFTVGRMSFAHRDGILEAKSLVSVIIETGLLLLSASFLFALALSFLSGAVVPSGAYYLFLLAPFSLLVIYPPVFNRILKPALRFFKQPEFTLNLSYSRLLRIFLLYVTDWLVQSIGCFFLINSFYPFEITRLPMLIGGYSISWILGFIVLIAPAGLGIREGIYTYILKLVMPESIAIISALLTRIWMSSAELIMALFCLPLLRRKRN